MPERIQRKRTKGWRMPEKTIYVGRPGLFGNPYDWRKAPRDLCPVEWSRGVAVDLFRQHVLRPIAVEDVHIRQRFIFIRDGLQSLRGKNLACWCPLDKPCHADVLLELANR